MPHSIDLQVDEALGGSALKPATLHRARSMLSDITGARQPLSEGPGSQIESCRAPGNFNSLSRTRACKIEGPKDLLNALNGFLDFCRRTLKPGPVGH